MLAYDMAGSVVLQVNARFFPRNGHVGRMAREPRDPPRDRMQLVCPVAGIILVALIIPNPFYTPHIPFLVGLMAWCVDLLVVLILPAYSIGARIGPLVAGIFLAVPCFTATLPLLRGLLMCFTAVPFLAAIALAGAPRLQGFRARLAHLCFRSGIYQGKQPAHRLDAAALLQLVIATAVFAAAMAVVKVTPAFGQGLPVRWLAGGIMIFAVAEMATAGLPLVAAAFGVAVWPFMQSPYRSASIGEFWTRRWNIYTSALARKYCFAPLARRGVALALFTTFFISAVAHVLLFAMAAGRWKMSLICGAFFLVQPLLIGIERRLKVRHWHRAAARTWTLTALALTSPLFVEPALQIFEKSWGAPGDMLLPVVATLGFVLGFSGILSLVAFAACRAT